LDSEKIFAASDEGEKFSNERSSWSEFEEKRPLLYVTTSANRGLVITMIADENTGH
jgi:hypothetical protein